MKIFFRVLLAILSLCLASLFYLQTEIKTWFSTTPARIIPNFLDISHGHRNSSGITTSADMTGRFLGSGSCKIPNMDPFDRSLRPYIKDFLPPDCSFALNFVQSHLNGSISVNRTAFEQEHINQSKVKCYYEEIYRVNGQRNKVKSESAQPLTEALHPNSDVVRVWCRLSENETSFRSFYDDILPVYKAREDLRMREGDEKPNVLILSQDALSRLNAIRALPKVYRHLNDHLKAHIFKVHVKCGFGSIQNMMGFLTGKRWGNIVSKGKFLRDELKLGRGKSADHWPFIWKEFQRKGYATALAESHISTIISVMNSAVFEHKPTDHYMHTVVSAQKQYKSIVSPPCLMNSPSYIATYRWVSNIMRLYANVPVFVVQHEGTTHNDIGQFRLLDDPLFDTLKSLENEKLLENTILIVSGDHGTATAPFRATPTGRLEFDTPFFSIALPEKLRRKYPHLDKVLIHNEDQLTSMYDLHATLLDIVNNNFNGSEDDYHNNRGRGLSLFKKIPSSRTCVDAGISLDNCPCLNFSEVPFENQLVKTWAKAVMREVNKKTGPKHICFEHTLKSIRMAKTYELQVSPGSMMKGIQMIVETNPRGALFDAYLYYMDSKKKQLGISDVYRMDEYWSEKICIGSRPSPFCHCRK